MPSFDFLWLFIYPASLVLVLGFRIVCASHQPNPQAHRKIAQASYWGEYADSNKNDHNVMQIPAVTKPQEQSTPGGRSVVPYQR